jgi:hypothetical protein
LRYDKSPPYTLIENATFSADDMLLAFDHAEVRFDAVLFPMPDLDVSWTFGKEPMGAFPEDIAVRIGNGRFIAKLQLNSVRPLSRAGVTGKTADAALSDFCPSRSAGSGLYQTGAKGFIRSQPVYAL